MCLVGSVEDVGRRCTPAAQFLDAVGDRHDAALHHIMRTCCGQSDCVIVCLSVSCLHLLMSADPFAGDSFVKVIGGGQSSLEALLLKRRIKGPCWLRLAQPERVAEATRQARTHSEHGHMVESETQMNGSAQDGVGAFADSPRTDTESTIAQSMADNLVNVRAGMLSRGFLQQLCCAGELVQAGGEGGGPQGGHRPAACR